MQVSDGFYKKLKKLCEDEDDSNLLSKARSNDLLVKDIDMWLKTNIPPKNVDPLRDSFLDDLTMENAMVYAKIFEAELEENNENCSVPNPIYKLDISYFIEKDEVKSAIEKIKGNIPGPDGWNRKDVNGLDKKLSFLFNLVFQTGLIPEIWKSNRTFFQPKIGQQGTDIKNYRPITVGSVFLKILHKILEIRISSNIKYVYKNFHGSFEQNEKIAKETLQDIINKYNRKEHHIISLDIEKAYDTVEHSTMLRSLRRFAVDKVTERYIMESYHDTFTVIEIGNERSDKILLNRGLKQGDPLSHRIFNMIMDEWFSIVDHKLGLEYNRDKIVSVCCSDNVLLLTNNQKDGQELINSYQEFLDKRGFNLNTEKSMAMSFIIDSKTNELSIVTDTMFFWEGKPLKQSETGKITFCSEEFTFSGCK